jgi:hypothetical protein
MVGVMMQMNTRILFLALVGLCATLWTPVTSRAGQVSTAQFHLADVADSAWVADSLADFASKNPDLHGKLLTAIAKLRKLATEDSPQLSLVEIMKARQTNVMGDSISLGSVHFALEFIKTLFINELRVALEEAGISKMRIISLREPVTLYQRSQLTQAYTRNQLRLNRYAQKFGPGAPRLNVLEALLAYSFQGIYPFGPGTSGPGPLEWVAGYSTSYLMMYQESRQDIPQEITVGAMWEAGLRYYLFAGTDRVGFWDLLVPRYLAAGAAFGSHRDWFFFAHDEDWEPGFFVDVGGIKGSVLFGDDDYRVYLGRQFQFIPHLF